MSTTDNRRSAKSRLAGFLRSSLSPASHNPWVVGVDISPWMLRLVLLERSRTGSLRVVRCQGQPLDPLWDLDSPALVRALHDGLKSLGLNRGPLEIWTGPVSDRVHLHHLELPKMKRNQLSQAVYWGLQREEAFSPTETAMDYEVEREFGGDKKGLLAVTGYLVPKDDRDTLARLFRQAGYPLYGMALPLHAIRNHFRSGWMTAPEGAIAFCHIGANSTRISIMVDDRLVLTRGLPVGIEQLADALLESLTPVPQRTLALRMILDLGREPWTHPPYQSDEVFAALSPALERMARQVDRTLEYYRIQFSNGDQVRHVFLAGALNESPRCRDYIARKLPAPLEPIDPFAGHESQTVDSAQVPESELERQAYATAFGFALSAEDQAPNFLQTFKERERNQLYQRLNIGIFVVFALLALVLGGVYANQRREIGELQATHARLQARVQAERPLIEADVLIARAVALQGDHRARLAALDQKLPHAIVAELGNLTPPGILLTSVAAQVAGSPASAGAPQRWLRVSGQVTGDPDMLETELSLYVRTLEGSPLFRTVEVRNRALERRASGVELDFAFEIQLPEPAMEVLP